MWLLQQNSVVNLFILTNFIIYISLLYLVQHKKIVSNSNFNNKSTRTLTLNNPHSWLWLYNEKLVCIAKIISMLSKAMEKKIKENDIMMVQIKKTIEFEFLHFKYAITSFWDKVKCFFFCYCYYFYSNIVFKFIHF